MIWNMEFWLDLIFSRHGKQLNQPALPPFLHDNPTAWKCINKYCQENLESLIDLQFQKILNYILTQDIIGQGPFFPVHKKMSAAGQEHKHEKLAQDAW